MKERLLALLIIVEIIGLMLIISSCNPCKQVAKHPECFMPDTIKLTEYKTKYVKEVVTNDSIIYSTIPCNPKDSLVYELQTIYKTNWKTSIDTIYTDKVIDRINPINDVLKSDNAKLLQKNGLKGKVIWIESILLLIIALLVYIKSKLYI